MEEVEEDEDSELEDDSDDAELELDPSLLSLEELSEDEDSEELDSAEDEDSELEDSELEDSEPDEDSELLEELDSALELLDEDSTLELDDEELLDEDDEELTLELEEDEELELLDELDDPPPSTTVSQLRTVFVPPPGVHTSGPLPPSIQSFPSNVIMTSPPLFPQIVSFPPIPKIVSAPFPPQMTSSPDVPKRVLPPFPPTMVAERPLHVGVVSASANGGTREQRRAAILNCARAVRRNKEIIDFEEKEGILQKLFSSYKEPCTLNVITRCRSVSQTLHSAKLHGLQTFHDL